MCAHGLVVDVETAPPTVILRATYDHAEAAGRADVSVFRPGSESNLYQSGTTDAEGAFAFVPSTPGNWRAVVDDGFGHRTEVSIDWAGAQAHASVASAGASTTWRNALTGVSLLIGLTGVWLWRQSRQRR
jgi:nickel transport protein